MNWTVTIKVLDNGKYQTYSGWGNQTFVAFIDIDYWSDILLDYKVRVTAVDKAGNELVMEKEIEGFFGGILEFLADIWDAIVGVVMAAWEAVVAALNFLIDWIVEGFRSGLVSLINGVANMIEGAFAGFIDQVEGVSNKGALEDWEISLLMVPLAITAWDIVEKIRDVFDCAEKLEITLSAILTATGIGGAVKTILSKITLETVKKVLLKVLLGFAIGALAESSSKLLDRKELEDHIGNGVM